VAADQESLSCISQLRKPLAPPAQARAIPPARKMDFLLVITLIDNPSVKKPFNKHP
jgi:hypothetical protein